MAEEAGRSVELRDYLEILWRRKWVVVLAFSVVFVVGVYRSVSQTKVYRANGQVLLNDDEEDASAIETQLRVLQGQAVRDRVHKELPTAGPVFGAQIGKSRILDVAVEGEDPKVTAKAVDVYIAAYADYRREQQVDQLLKTTEATRKRVDDLKSQVATLSADYDKQLTDIDNRHVSPAGESDAGKRLREQNYQRDVRDLNLDLGTRRDSLRSDQLLLEGKVRDLNAQSDLARPAAEIVNPAVVPTSPIRPNPVSDGVTAAAAGLLLGVGLAFLFEYLDDSVKTKADVAHAIGPSRPVLAIIPALPEWKDRATPEVVSLSAPRSPAAEAFRSLRTSVQFASLDHTVNTVAVTSPTAGEGKTTALANLGVVLANAGRRVILIDCDLRRPRIHSFFGMSNEVGLTSWMIGGAPVSEVVKPVPGVRRLSLLASGPIPPNPSELLSSGRFAKLLETLQEGGALLLIDTPPLLPVTDAAVIARSIDSVLLISMAGRSTRKQLRQAVEILDRVDAPLTGIVLNGADVEQTSYYHAGYGIPTGETVPATVSREARTTRSANPGTRSRQAPKARLAPRPANPARPTNPTKPASPANPTNLANPTNPANPANPTNPANPAHSNPGPNGNGASNSPPPLRREPAPE